MSAPTSAGLRPLTPFLLVLLIAAAGAALAACASGQRGEPALLAPTPPDYPRPALGMQAQEFARAFPRAAYLGELPVGPHRATMYRLRYRPPGQAASLEAFYVFRDDRFFRLDHERRWPRPEEFEDTVVPVLSQSAQR